MNDWIGSNSRGRPRAWISAPWGIERHRVQQIIDGFVANRPRCSLLDAGCGSAAHFEIPPHVHRTGIDVSARQLERNSQLNEKILGDLEVYRLPERRFDLIVCWDVLEHLARPRHALLNLSRALAPGGLMLVGLPHVFSPKGLATRFTPLRTHVWFYRHVHGSPAAGSEDVGPFPTYMRLAISPGALRRFAREIGLGILYVGLYEGSMQRRARARYGVTGKPWRALRAGTLLATGGMMDIATTDAVLVLTAPSHG